MSSASQPSPGADAAPVPVLIVDDHDLFRAGLRMLLEGEGIRIVGDGRCSTATVSMASRTRPRVILVDGATAAGESTEDVVTALVEAAPTAAVLVFARSTAEEFVYRIVRAGAMGYLAKDAPVPVVADAIRALASGGAWLAPDVAATVLGFVRTGRVPMQAMLGLSLREREVLRLLARGLDNGEIAAELQISAKTVKNHVSNLLSKLGLVNRVQAAVLAVRSGIA